MRDRHGVTVDQLDIGGGFAVPYVDGDPAFDVTGFADRVRCALTYECARRRLAVPRLVWRRRIAEAATEALHEVAVRGDTERPITRLSGGNQQKVLFARAALQRPELLLLDEPTKGVDIGAKAEIHALIRTMAEDRDVAVIVVSTEEDELIGLADAVRVFRNGSCDGTRSPRGSVTPGDLRRLAWPSSGPSVAMGG